MLGWTKRHNLFMTPPMRGVSRGFLSGVVFTTLAAGLLVGVGSGSMAQGLTLPLEAAALPLPAKKPEYVHVALPQGFVPARKPNYATSTQAPALAVSTYVPAKIPYSAKLDKVATPRSSVYGNALKMLHQGNAQQAYNSLRPSLDAGAQPQHMNWLAGLAAYRLQRGSLAENHFKAAASAAGDDAWLKAGAYYWASRAALMAENFAAVDAYLAEAAQYDRTFYGMVAARALGQNIVFDWNGEEAARYPVTQWQPLDGWQVDPALLNAIIRQESRFATAAQNGSSKATGLMQIMPATGAIYLGGNKEQAAERLRDPSTNITVGQRYIRRLLSETDGKLFDLVMSYNAGPYAVKGWAQNLADVKSSDPLLFIELIPYAETRNFVERVVSNYWIYQHRFGQPTMSLDAVAAGDTPQYTYASKGTEYAKVAGE